MSQESKEFENVPTEADGLEVVEDEYDADGMTCDANGVMSVDKSTCVCSLMKSRWLFLLIKEVIAKMPNMSNREMKNLMSDYVIRLSS